MEPTSVYVYHNLLKAQIETKLKDVMHHIGSRGAKLLRNVAGVPMSVSIDSVDAYKAS